MSKIGNYVVEMQEMASTTECHVCKGFGEVEVQIAVDCFREDECDFCGGSGQILDESGETE
tara:strand:+ start:519 stop:701 length:183 start_codon:yes stop_codon:yes gene_type:complete